MIDAELVRMLLLFENEDRLGDDYLGERLFSSRVVRLAMAFARETAIDEVLNVFRYQQRPHQNTRVLVDRVNALKEKRADRLTPAWETSSGRVQ